MNHDADALSAENDVVAESWSSNVSALTQKLAGGQGLCWALIPQHNGNFVIIT